MNKPVKHYQHDPCYDYQQVIEWVESKYKFDARDYKREVDGKYKDFWLFVVDGGEIHNGCYFGLPDLWTKDDDGEYSPWWVREILELIHKEFPDIEDQEVYLWW